MGNPSGQARFREILQFGPNATRTKYAAERAIDILINHGWVTTVSAKPRILKAITP
jgi:hypothetical protein